MSRPIADYSLLRSETSTLLQGHPSAGPLPYLAPSSLNGLFKGTIQSIDSKTFECIVLKWNAYNEPPIKGRLSYAYCSGTSGIIAMPEVGSQVIYWESYESGDFYANILAYIPGNVLPASFSAKDKSVPQNPGFELFGSVFSGKTGIYKDQGMVPGDQAILGSDGNKLKIFKDKSVLLKCTDYNFTLWSPIDDRMYQWCFNPMLRTPGSYDGQFNVISAQSASSMHYAIKRHFVNPLEQGVTFQEEIGLVDNTTTAVAGNFEDVPNSEMVQSSASLAQSTNPTTNLSGYSVCKRKIFDFGGRDFSKKTSANKDEFFCEEYKTDGAYRVHFGMRKPGAVRPTQGVECYYKPSGEWSIGSQFGKIKVTANDMFLSTATHEISLNALITFATKHVHGYVGQTGILATSSVETSDVPTPANTWPAVGNNKIPGLGTGYVPDESIKQDSNLVWD